MYQLSDEAIQEITLWRNDLSQRIDYYKKEAPQLFGYPEFSTQVKPFEDHVVLMDRILAAPQQASQQDIAKLLNLQPLLEAGSTITLTATIRFGEMAVSPEKYGFKDSEALEEKFHEAKYWFGVLAKSNAGGHAIDVANAMHLPSLAKEIGANVMAHIYSNQKSSGITP